MAAEIGIMRISEQIDALETMDIDPLRFLVSPRIAAALISFPLLTAIFDVVGILGGYLTGSVLLGVNPEVYFSRVESSVALVRLKILRNVELTDDVIASVKTAGLIGDKYIKLTPGGSDEILGPEDVITETESALDIEELTGKYAFGDV